MKNMRNGFVRWKKYFNPRNDYMKTYLYNHGDIFLDQIISKIDSAISKNKSEIELFAFKNSKTVVMVSKAEYYDALDKLLKFCISTEKYEYCRKIQNVIDKKVIEPVKKRKSRSKLVSK
jgi:hypothetical protein